MKQRTTTLICPVSPGNDLRLVGRAIKNRWAIPPEIREKLHEELVGVLKNPDAKDNNKARAAEVLLKMDKLNLDDEKMRMATLTVSEQSITEMTDDELDAYILQAQEQLKQIK